MGGAVHSLAGAGVCLQLTQTFFFGVCLLVSSLQLILGQAVRPSQRLLLLCAAIATPSAALTASQITSAQPWIRQPSLKTTTIWRMKQQRQQQQRRQPQEARCQPGPAG
jgi:hypothetical protein